MNLDEVRAAIVELARIDAIPRLIYLNGIRQNPLLADDANYRSTYNGYYRVRQRPPEFYSAMFALLGQTASRELPLELPLLMTRLFDATGERHLSFSSKILV